MDVSTTQQGNASRGGGPEPPRQEGCPALPRALTLQYSSMGFSLFTATSRTWLLRNRILPKERTHERGGLGASPAMWDSTAAPSRQVSRQSFIPASSHGCYMKPGWLPPQSCLCEQRVLPSGRGPGDWWDRGGGFWFHPADNTKGFGSLVLMALPWDGLTLCYDLLLIQGHFGMSMLAVQEASLDSICSSLSCLPLWMLLPFQADKPHTQLTSKYKTAGDRALINLHRETKWKKKNKQTLFFKTKKKNNNPHAFTGWHFCKQLRLNKQPGFVWNWL